MGDRFFDSRKLILYTIFAATSLSSVAFSDELLNLSSSPVGNESGVILTNMKPASPPREKIIPNSAIRNETTHPNIASPQEALLLRRITEYWKDGDYATVKRQVIDFLTKNPETPLRDPLNSMLGDLYFQEHNFQQSLASYDAIQSGEIKEKIFFNHLQAHFEMRDYLPVIEKGEHFLKEKNKSVEVDPLKVRYLVAEAYFRYSLSTDDMEKKVFYLKLAKPHYKILSQTSYSERALFPLAEIHRLLREDDRAASLYLTLAEKHPEHRERFLFQAAILQIKENKFEAISTFFKIHEMGGKRSRLAAFNALILMYQTEQYEDYLRFHKETISLMPEQKAPLLNFYEGRSHYALGNYPQAVLALENYININKEKSKELKTAFLLLANCSRYLKDIPLLERTSYAYQTIFPQDSDAAKVLMIHAQMSRDNGDLHQAVTDLKTLIASYPDNEETEAALYDCALLLSQTDQWGEAREMFSAFLNQFPESDRKNSAWRHLLNCSIEELRNNSDKQSFVTVVEKALVQENVLSQKEKDQYLLAMMKCQYELGQLDAVVPRIADYITKVADRSLLAEAHLLMAICQKSDTSLFIHHGETALQNNPKLAENTVLHLELYNAYLTKGLCEIEDKSFFYGRSAQHLFASGAWKEGSIKLENYLWLTNFYYNQAVSGRDFDKAKLLYTNLLGAELSVDLEIEALKFAHLLDIYKERKEQIEILKELIDKQQSDAPWKLKRRALLELARAYEADGQTQNAVKYYTELTSGSERSASIVTSTAQLHLAKLQYNLITPSERTSENPEVIAILHDLKDLQIQKKLLAEPLHLEAALQYAEIRCNMAAPENAVKNSHFFYKRMYDDFNNLEDPIIQEYSFVKAQHPEKNAIFSAYMNYLQAQMLKCEAEMYRAKNKTSKANECQNKALELLNTLLQNKDYLQPYLLDRIKRIKAEISKEL